MTLPIFLPFLLFTHALNKVSRRHRLSEHHLDPDLVDELARTRDAPMHRAYAEHYAAARKHAGNHVRHCFPGVNTVPGVRVTRSDGIPGSTGLHNCDGVTADARTAAPSSELRIDR